MTISLEKDEQQVVESGTNFTRYQIIPETSEHRYPVPHPFVPKVKKTGLAKILVKEMFEYNFKLLQSKYRQTLLSRPCIYGVFSGPFGGFAPIEDLCTGCMRCVEEYPEVCSVDRNPEFSQFGDSFWLPEDPDKVSESPFGTIWYEARTGNILVKGMGYKGFFSGDGWDSMWTDMSEIVRPTRDGVYGREFISTQVDIGAKPSQLEFPIRPRKYRVTSIPIPMLFDYLPDNLLSKSIAQSIVQAANKTETKYIFDPIQIDKYGLNLTDGLILYINNANFGNIGSHISNASAILLDQSSINLLDRVRSIKSDIPVLVRLPFNDDLYENIEECIGLEMDGFLLYADYHGKGFDSNEFIGDLIGSVHRRLVEEGLRDKVTLLTSGGIILAEHVPKAIIMGSDAICINTSVLVALQVKFKTECKIPEKSIVSATEFDPQWGGNRLRNMLSAWHNQLIEIMSAMGIKEVRRLRGDTGRAMYREELEEVAFGDIERID